MDTKNKEIDDTNESYFQMSSKKVNALKKSGVNPYPHKFEVDTTINNLRETYGSLENGAHLENVIVKVAGRIKAIRDSSKKLKFYTIVQDGVEIQVMARLDIYGNKNGDFDKFSKITSEISRGDIVGFIGFVGKTKTGELSIFPSQIEILSRCLRVIPNTHFGLKDDETRIRQRYLDLLVNPKTRETFVMRSKIINYIREFLTKRNFIEVQTPILTPQAGGATAKPFYTHHNHLNIEMALRIAPELYLKQLIVGGFERVFEIGSQFRNESIDTTHSPEFTSLEFYMTYIDYNDLMSLAEQLFSEIVFTLYGKYVVKCTKFDGSDSVDIDFTPHFKRFDFVEEIEKNCGVTLPSDFSTEEANLFLSDLCTKHNIDCSAPRTTSRLLDKLAGRFIEPQCVNPSFIINHPLVMSPLAKPHRDFPNLSERFEMFIMGFEFANAYTELNDPFEQRKTFEDQMRAKASGDDEAQNIDENFINALEYGMPPTGGFGMGIDRLVMLLTDNTRIQNVILFPPMKPV